jgi:hypothetical protein
VAPEGCSLEHKERRRGGVTVVKGGNGSSSAREWRKARESSVVRGDGVGAPGGNNQSNGLNVIDGRDG